MSDLPVPFSNPTTSLAAAGAMRKSGRAATQVARVLEFLRSRVAEGATFYEIDEALHIGIRQTTARTRALVIAGYVYDSGVTRRSDSGHANTVWLAIDREAVPVPLAAGPQIHGRIAAAVRRERLRYEALEGRHLEVLEAFGRGEYLTKAQHARGLEAERAAVLRLIETALAERWARERLRAAVTARSEPALALEPEDTIPGLAEIVPAGEYRFRKTLAGSDSWDFARAGEDWHEGSRLTMLQVLRVLAGRPAPRARGARRGGAA